MYRQMRTRWRINSRRPRSAGVRGRICGVSVRAEERQREDKNSDRRKEKDRPGPGGSRKESFFCTSPAWCNPIFLSPRIDTHTSLRSFFWRRKEVKNRVACTYRFICTCTGLRSVIFGLCMSSDCLVVPKGEMVLLARCLPRGMQTALSILLRGSLSCADNLQSVWPWRVETKAISSRSSVAIVTTTPSKFLYLFL